MGTVYATSDDYITYYGALTAEEITRVNALLSAASAGVRFEAKKRGRDIDYMLTDDDDIEEILKSVVCDVAHRYMEQQGSGNASTLTQESQSGLGYSWSGSYVNTGGGLTILNKDLKRLGLLRPRYTVVDLLGGRGDLYD